MNPNTNNSPQAIVQEPANLGTQYSLSNAATSNLFDAMWNATINDTTPVTKADSNDRTKRTYSHSGKKQSPPKKPQTGTGTPATRIAQARGQAPKPDDSLKNNIDEQTKLDAVRDTSLKATATHHCTWTQCLVIHITTDIDYQAELTVQKDRLAQASAAIEQFCIAKGITHNGIVCSVGSHRTKLHPAVEINNLNKNTAMGHHGDIFCGIATGSSCCHDIAIPADTAVKHSTTIFLSSHGIYVIAESDPFLAVLLDTKRQIVRCTMGQTGPLQPIWEPIVTKNIPCEPAEGSCLVTHASLYFYGMQHYPTRAEASSLFLTLCRALKYQIEKQKRPPKKDTDALKTFMDAPFLVIRVKAFSVKQRPVRQFTFASVSMRNLAERLCISTGQAAEGLATWAWKSVSAETDTAKITRALSTKTAIHQE